MFDKIVVEFIKKKIPMYDDLWGEFELLKSVASLKIIAHANDIELACPSFLVPP